MSTVITKPHTAMERTNALNEDLYEQAGSMQHRQTGLKLQTDKDTLEVRI